MLVFAFTDLALNLTFHWFTVKDQVFGKFGLPEHLHLIVPAAFVGWGLFFMRGSFTKAVVPCLTGVLGALVVMGLGSGTADSPDFWGLALWVGISSAALVLLSTTRGDDLLAPAPAFLAFASVLLWWFATGLDRYVPGGMGPGTVEALGAAVTNTPLAAGTGAFGGLLSMPWTWVVISTFVSLTVGVAMGWLTVTVTGWLSRPAPAPAAAESARVPET